MVTDVPAAPEVGDKLLILGVTVKLPTLIGLPPMVTITLPVVAPLGTDVEMLALLQLVTVAAAPLNVTVLLPCELPKFVPLMITEVPIGPELGDRPLLAGVTVKFTPLLAFPAAVRTTLPEVAPAGTVTETLVLLQLVAVAAVPLNVTVLLPCELPKFVPFITTAVPTAPETGNKLLIAGVAVKLTPWLALPPTVTTTFPVLAPFGTGTEMLVSLQFVAVAAVPLNVIVLLPGELPKPVPLIVIEAPTGADAGDKPVIAGITVKLTPLLALPPAVTTTFPVEAAPGTGTVILALLQAVGVAAAPLNVTVLLPWLVPKLLPLMVIEVPVVPLVGDNELITGITENGTLLLARPATVMTTFPLLAPLGTGTTTLVSLQLLGVAVTPFNVTVLVPCVAPNSVPEIVIEEPITAALGESSVIKGGTPNDMPLLATPPGAVTTTLPVRAPSGTVALMLVLLHTGEQWQSMPSKLTVPMLSCAAPKFVPEIVTAVPATPTAGDTVVIAGAGTTVNVEPLLGWPPTLTTRLPVVVPAGTNTMILVAPQASIV